MSALPKPQGLRHNALLVWPETRNEQIVDSKQRGNESKAQLDVDVNVLAFMQSQSSAGRENGPGPGRVTREAGAYQVGKGKGAAPTVESQIAHLTAEEERGRAARDLKPISVDPVVAVPVTQGATEATESRRNAYMLHRVHLPPWSTLGVVSFSIVFWVLILALLSYVHRRKTGDPRKIERIIGDVEDSCSPRDGNGSAPYVTTDGDELLERMGLSAMALIDMEYEYFGKATRQNFIFLAIQSWLLQFGMLYYLLSRLQASTEESTLPRIMVFMAIYLHLVSCLGQLPLALEILWNLNELHERTTDLCLATIVFFIDQLVLPISTIIIGGLYLCTSRGVEDLILNSCAVAFVGQIDDWILGFHVTVLKHGGKKKHVSFQIPTNYNLAKLLNRACSQTPIVPFLLTAGLTFTGLVSLQL